MSLRAHVRVWLGSGGTAHVVWRRWADETQAGLASRSRGKGSGYRGIAAVGWVPPVGQDSAMLCSVAGAHSILPLG